ncbi:MAG: hypothetical protein ABI763_13740 [Bacteroidota bacterium]
MASKYTIKDMQLLASDHEGKCLSKEYWGLNTKLNWMCEKGHTWDAFPYAIKQGAWCRQCIKGKTTKATIEEMQVLATQNQGKCVSTEYVNTASKLEWQCKEGHIWEAKPMHIKKGGWCPTCAGKAKHTIEQMQELATTKGGKCLSTEYINSYSNLKWQCDKGHQWEAMPTKIISGHWCTHYDCRYKEVSKKLRRDIKELHLLAQQKGGKLLSTEYTNSLDKLIWECSKGHQWKTTAVNVMNGNTWCPVCMFKEKKRRNKDSVIIKQ